MIITSKTPKKGGRAIGVVCDVRDYSQVCAARDRAVAEFGRIDILINNAALWRSKSSFLDTPTEEWKKYIDVNVMGTVYFSKAVLPSMLEHS